MIHALALFDQPQYAKIKNHPQNKLTSELKSIGCYTYIPLAVLLVRERFREYFKMDGKHVFALAFAIAAAIAVNVVLFGGLFLLVNP
ncbi:hypothetical protein FSG86_003220 [Escherichia coli]|nr:hypothetical protein [Escherichia coli]